MKTLLKSHAAVMAALVFLAGTHVARAQADAAEPSEEIMKAGLHTAQPLHLEPVGLPSVKAWYRELTPGRANDQSPWTQLIWFKKDSRTTQKSYFALVDFVKGTLKELPAMVPAMEPYASAWVGGKYYQGMNLPARLTVFDPAEGTLTDLGPCFSDKSLTCYRMAVTPDGMIAMGGGTGSDVSLYDPKTKAYTHFGQVASKPGGGTYSYYLSADDKYIYIAVRSSDPWELVRLDRKTKERTVLLTAPPQTHMTVNGNTAEVAAYGANSKKWYTLADGQATERPAQERPTLWKLPGPGFTGDPPKIGIDQAPIIAGEDALIIHIQSPDGKEWRQARLPLKPDVNVITQLMPLDDGRLAGVPAAYFAMVLVDPKTGKTERYPLQISAYGLLAVGQRIFIAGYPSSRTLVFDTTRPMTWTEGIPGRPGVKDDDPGANPRLMRYFGQDTGGAHIALHLNKGADGNVYMAAKRHRYFFGFALAWFNPEPGAKGEFTSGVFNDEGAFNHLQVTAMRAVDGGKQLLITTAVQYNKQLPGQAPERAAIFRFDVAQKKIVGRYEPLPWAKSIEAVTMAGPDILVGSAAGYHPRAASSLFRYNIRTGKCELTRHYEWNLGQTMAYQPDGKIWATCGYGNYSVLFTIDPRDLTLSPVGQVAPLGGVAMLFHQGALYLGGHETIMRVKDLEIPGAPGQAVKKPVGNLAPPRGSPSPSANKAPANAVRENGGSLR